MRSAAAFGAHGVFVPDRRAAGVTATAWRTSAGAAARVPVARVTNLTRSLKACQQAGFVVAGLDADGETSLYDLEAAVGPIVLVVGSEGRGLSRLVGQSCDLRVSIPMASEVESLNASVAAAVALAEVARRRAVERASRGPARGRRGRDVGSTRVRHGCRPRHLEHGRRAALAGRPHPAAALRRRAGAAVRRVPRRAGPAARRAGRRSGWPRWSRPGTSRTRSGASTRAPCCSATARSRPCTCSPRCSARWPGPPSRRSATCRRPCSPTRPRGVRAAGRRWPRPPRGPAGRRRDWCPSRSPPPGTSPTCCAARSRSGSSLAVFDFGGGTLDIAVVRNEGAHFAVLGSGGIEDLGGLDIDAALVDHLGRIIAAARPDALARAVDPRDHRAAPRPAAVLGRRARREGDALPGGGRAGDGARPRRRGAPHPGGARVGGGAAAAAGRAGDRLGDPRVRAAAGRAGRAVPGRRVVPAAAGGPAAARRPGHRADRAGAAGAAGRRGRARGAGAGRRAVQPAGGADPVRGVACPGACAVRSGAGLRADRAAGVGARGRAGVGGGAFRRAGIGAFHGAGVGGGADLGAAVGTRLAAGTAVRPGDPVQHAPPAPGVAPPAPGVAPPAPGAAPAWPGVAAPAPGAGRGRRRVRAPAGAALSSRVSRPRSCSPSSSPAAGGTSRRDSPVEFAALEAAGVDVPYGADSRRQPGRHVHGRRRRVPGVDPWAQLRTGGRGGRGRPGGPQEAVAGPGRRRVPRPGRRCTPGRTASCCTRATSARPSPSPWWCSTRRTARSSGSGTSAPTSSSSSTRRPWWSRRTPTMTARRAASTWRNGAEKWSARQPGGRRRPAWHDDDVRLGRREGRGVGRLRWRRRQGRSRRRTPARAVRRASDTMRVVDVATGKARERAGVTVGSDTPVLAFGDKAYLIAPDNGFQVREYDLAKLGEPRVVHTETNSNRKAAMPRRCGEDAHLLPRVRGHRRQVRPGGRVEHRGRGRSSGASPRRAPRTWCRWATG